MTPIACKIVKKGYILSLLNDTYEKIQKINGFTCFSEEAETIFKNRMIEVNNYEPKSYRDNFAMNIIAELKGLNWVYEIQQNNLKIKHKINILPLDNSALVYSSQVKE